MSLRPSNFWYDEKTEVIRDVELPTPTVSVIIPERRLFEQPEPEYDHHQWLS